MMNKIIFFSLLTFSTLGQFLNYSPNISTHDLQEFGCWPNRRWFKIKEFKESKSDKYKKNFLCISNGNSIIGSILSNKEVFLKEEKFYKPTFSAEGKIVPNENSKKFPIEKCDYSLDVTKYNFSTNGIKKYTLNENISTNSERIVHEIIINKNKSFKIFLPKNIPDAKKPTYRYIETNIPLLKKLMKVSNVGHDLTEGSAFNTPEFEAYDLNEDNVVDIVFLHDCGHVVFIVSSKDGYKVARGCLPSCG
ncbi:MAG: hypothetical protein NXH75_09695 [Halobacteriovoraceae bacterium]|nr:hypothetical protein [Halobacteriovoraceae bacterium]